jgi:CRP-like cAMP-binding protein
MSYSKRDSVFIHSINNMITETERKLIPPGESGSIIKRDDSPKTLRVSYHNSRAKVKKTTEKSHLNTNIMNNTEKNEKLNNSLKAEENTNFVKRGSNLMILNTLNNNFKLSNTIYNEGDNKTQGNDIKDYLNLSEKEEFDEEEDEENLKEENSRIVNNTLIEGNNNGEEVTENSDEDKEEANDKVDSHLEEGEDKEKKEKVLKLWERARKMLKGITSFQKMNKNLQLYGTSDDVFDEKHPEKYLAKLKRIQTTNEVKDESKNRNSKCCDIPVFMPESIFINFWNVIVSLLMIYTALIMPYRVSFIDTDDPNWEIVENVIDFLFFTDILININLAYISEHDNTLIKSRKKIFFQYLKSWMIVDIIASFPQNLVFQSASVVLKKSDFLRIARLPKLYRLVRIVRFLKIAKFFRKISFIQKLQDFFNINFGVSRLFSFLFTTLILSHLVGCLWYIIPKLYDEQNSWVVKSGLRDEPTLRLYLFSLYWSFSTIFTVGFGDIHAYNTVEYVISIIWMLFGVGFYSFTIGTLSSVLVNMDTRENILKFKLSILNEFAKETKLSSNLKERVKKILIYNSQKNVFSWIDKQEIFNELPANLKCDIAKSMREGFLKDIAFFNSKEDAFVAMIVPFLVPLNFQEKEPIYKKSDHPNAIYFLTSGRVHFVNDDYIPFRTMVKGSYFGEIDIILKQKRAHTVIAGEACDSLTLSKQIYENVIIKEYPEIDEEIKYIAHLRIEKNLQSEKELHDIINNRNKKKSRASIFPFSTKTVNEYSKGTDGGNNLEKGAKIFSHTSSNINPILASSSINHSPQIRRISDKKMKIGNKNQITGDESIKEKEVLPQNTSEMQINNNSSTGYDVNKLFPYHNLAANNKEVAVVSLNNNNLNVQLKSPESQSSYVRSANNITSDSASDYLSQSDEEKLQKRLEIGKMILKSKNNTQEKDTPTINVNNKGESREKYDFNEIKDEMKKYSKDQKEMMNNINKLLEDFKQLNNK